MKNSSFKERLTELMQKNNLRQADVVKTTGLDKSTISYYLNGKREPAQDNIFTISQAYNVDPAWLMGYEVPMEKQPIKRTYSAHEAAEILIIKENPNVRSLIDDYLKLTPEQQASVANLVQSMLPDKRP